MVTCNYSPFLGIANALVMEMRISKNRSILQLAAHPLERAESGGTQIGCNEASFTSVKSHKKPSCAPILTIYLDEEESESTAAVTFIQFQLSTFVNIIAAKREK
ncbi:unnamed protein product [Orchesella dallaii]|uniref:Uncharacterized protein n=1 Tax=Orchesella dallaii TaxID=48710 RepID=A0ABP1R4W5_9HEXA